CVATADAPNGTYNGTAYSTTPLPAKSGVSALANNGRPVIATQPQSTTTCVGSSVTFTVAATLQNGNLQYQWMYNGTNVPSANAAQYTDNRAGDYACIVSSS